jgi:hypothetical protein
MKVKDEAADKVDDENVVNQEQGKSNECAETKMGNYCS